MSASLSDVVLHIDESLPSDQVKTLENHIHKMGGVVSACNCDDTPHLISICLLYTSDAADDRRGV